MNKKRKGQQDKHHFLPRFYLQNFTPCGTEKGTFFVHFTNSGESRPIHPNGIGYEWDMNSWMEPDGQKVTGIEKELGNLDSQFAPVVSAIIRNNELPTTQKDIGTLHTFLATMAARSTRQRWLLKALSREEGLGDPDQKDQIGVMVDLIPLLIPHIRERKWRLITVPRHLRTLLCPSYPIVSEWTHSNYQQNIEPDIGVRNTTVLFPLGKRHLLEGSFEGVFKTTIQNRIDMAIVNTKMFKNGVEFLISTYHDSEIYFEQPHFRTESLRSYYKYYRDFMRSGDINIDHIIKMGDLAPIQIPQYLLPDKSKTR